MVRLEQDLSGETAREGQIVQLSVVEDVVIDGVAAIAKGANVTGKVLLVQPKRRMGRTGKIDFSIERVMAADQSNIPLRYTVNKKEGGSHAVSTGAITAGVAIAFFPAAPFVLPRRGNEAKVDKGTIFEVFTDQMRALSAKTHTKPAPVGMRIVVNGQTLEFQSVAASGVRLIFDFETTAAPEKIIVYGNDGSNGSNAVFDGKTGQPETGRAAASKPPASK